jgi:hypothetical protein
MCNCANRNTRNVTNTIWLLYQIISWLKTPEREFFVRSGEQNPCPCCSGLLEVIGSRKRNYINDAGEKNALIIRRLRCGRCERVHHELPDILVPYKRYCRESIEAAVTENVTLTVAADESTILRWRSWFRGLVNHFLGCLASIAIRNNEPVEELIQFPQSPLQRIWRFVGDAPGWLGRVVRPVANFNLWVHTRSAFLS